MRSVHRHFEKTMKENEGIDAVEDDSDVELEGMDMEGDVDATEDEDAAARVGSEETATVALKKAATDASTSSDRPTIREAEEETALARVLEAEEAEEREEREEALNERMELIKADQEELAKDESNRPVDAQSRLDYLLHQSDVFAHFLAGSMASSSAKKAGKVGKKGRGKGRLTEEEEDAQLLKSAQSKRRVVRLDHQPACLAPICKMHPYQLEGLNWLIKLHDHGINAILADGT